MGRFVDTEIALFEALKSTHDEVSIRQLAYGLPCRLVRTGSKYTRSSEAASYRSNSGLRSSIAFFARSISPLWALTSAWVRTWICGSKNNKIQVNNDSPRRDDCADLQEAGESTCNYSGHPALYPCPRLRGPTSSWDPRWAGQLGNDSIPGGQPCVSPS